MIFTTHSAMGARSAHAIYSYFSSWRDHRRRKISGSVISRLALPMVSALPARRPRSNISAPISTIPPTNCMCAGTILRSTSIGPLILPSFRRRIVTHHTCVMYSRGYPPSNRNPSDPPRHRRPRPTADEHWAHMQQCGRGPPGKTAQIPAYN
jgi:hypothetical protein